MAKVKRIVKSLLLFGLIILTLWVGLFSTPTKSKGASAFTVDKTAYEQTSVLDDLRNSTIGGEEFDLTKYSFNEKKDIEIISFVEYCYSYSSARQGNYGLYVYVYNPKGLLINTKSPLNTIQMSVGTNNVSYRKYTLGFLSRSNESDFEGLFYKFKVNMSESEKSSILDCLNSTARMYTVSGIEMISVGELNATDYKVANTYTYSGYAAGYGSNLEAESTLRCSVEGKEVLCLSVKPTQYRPAGTNGKNKYTQDSLHSVYFAVPNDVIKRFGAMTAVHATWRDAVLHPVMVTGNYSAYSAVTPFLGQSFPELDNRYHTDELRWMFYAQMEGLGGSNERISYGYGYNTLDAMGTRLRVQDEEMNYEINPLYMMFYAGSGTDSADNYVVSSEAIQSMLRTSTAKYGGELVNGKYSRCLFDSVAEEFTEVNIQADETYSLTNQIITRETWWQILFGKDNVTTSYFNGINAIYAVQEQDLSGTPEQIAQSLYISTTDVAEFKNFYEANKEDSTIYLFRYQVTEYVAQEAKSSYLEDRINIFGSPYKQWTDQDTNQYFFQETVNLDFDIIDVTFSNGESETVIPVVSNPIDVVPDATPPVITTSDEEPAWLKILKIILIVLIAAVLIYVGWPVLQVVVPAIIKGVVWLFKMLIKLLGKLFKGIGALFKKRKKTKEEKKKRNGKDE